MLEQIEIFGAKENNLKNISLAFPRNQLIVFTGVSGSGKSSLAFETIYAEAQRRYIDTFPAYVKQFLSLKRPKVDRILGLSPAISIEQKTVGRNPRSTVGTITEIYDFLRLLFAKVAVAYSAKTGLPMVQYPFDLLCKRIFEKYQNQNIQIFAPLIRGRKGHYRELFEDFRKKGFLKVRVDGKIYELEDPITLNRYQTHDIELLVDQLLVESASQERLFSSLQTAFLWGKETLLITL